MRVYWVDNLKAIGIFLVVLAHHENEIPKIILKYIYSFHVPLFFFASGVVFMPDKYRSLRDLLVNKTKTIIVPYLSFSLFTFLFWFALAPLRAGEVLPNMMEILKGIAGIVVSSNGIIWMTHNGPLWFLTCLFIVEVWFNLLYNVSLKLKSGKDTVMFLGSFVALLSILGALDRYFVHFRLPWGMDTALTGIALFTVGFISGKWLLSISKRITPEKIILFIVLLIASLTFSHFNDFVNLTFNRIGNYFWFYLASFSGIGLCTLISKAIPENKIFSFVGRNSLAILALHLPAYLMIRGVEKVMVQVVGLTMPEMSLWSAMFYSVIQLLMTVPIIYVINRYLPFMVGRRKISTTA